MNSFLKKITLIVLLIGIFGLSNFFANEFSWRWDLSDEKEFSISPATQNLLSKLKDRLTLKLYYSADLPPQLITLKTQTLDLIEEIKALSPRPIIVEFVDPGQTEEQENQTLQQGIVPLNINIVEKDQRVQKKFYMGMTLHYLDRKESLPTTVQAGQLEYNIALKLVKLLQDKKPQMGLMIPKESAEKYKAIQTYLNEFAQIIPINSETDLQKYELDTLVIIEPRNIPEKIMAELDFLLATGTNIAVFAGHQDVSPAMEITRITTGLEAWFKKFGLQLSENLVLDIKQNAEAPVVETVMGIRMQRYQPYAFWLASQKKELSTDHPITSQLETIVITWANAFEIEGKNSDWQTTTLVSTSQAAFLQQGETVIGFDYVETLENFPDLEKFPLSLVLKHTDPKYGSVFLTANFHMLRDNLIQMFPTNTLFLQNLFEHASWGNDLIGIRSRGKVARPLKDISQQQKNLIKSGHIFAIPVVTILLGLLALWQQKRRRDKLIQELKI